MNFLRITSADTYLRSALDTDLDSVLFSMSGWFRASSGPVNLFSIMSAADAVVANFSLSTTEFTATIGSSVTTPLPVDLLDGKWHHVVVVVGYLSYVVFIDSLQLAETSHSFSYSWPSIKMCIGGSAVDYDNFVYAPAILSHEEVVSLYNAGHGVSPAVVTYVNGYYSDMNDNTGATAVAAKFVASAETAETMTVWKSGGSETYSWETGGSIDATSKIYAYRTCATAAKHDSDAYDDNGGYRSSSVITDLNSVIRVVTALHGITGSFQKEFFPFMLTNHNKYSVTLDLSLVFATGNDELVATSAYTASEACPIVVGSFPTADWPTIGICYNKETGEAFTYSGSLLTLATRGYFNSRETVGAIGDTFAYFQQMSFALDPNCINSAGPMSVRPAHSLSNSSMKGMPASRMKWTDSISNLTLDAHKSVGIFLRYSMAGVGVNQYFGFMVEQVSP